MIFYSVYTSGDCKVASTLIPTPHSIIFSRVKNFRLSDFSKRNYRDKNFTVLQIKNNARLKLLNTNSAVNLNLRLEISVKRHL